MQLYADSPLLAIGSPDATLTKIGYGGSPMQRYFLKLADHPTLRVAPIGESHSYCTQNVMIMTGTNSIWEGEGAGQGSRYSHYMLVFLKQAGEWKIAGHHLTSLLDEPSPDEDMVGAPQDNLGAVPR